MTHVWNHKPLPKSTPLPWIERALRRLRLPVRRRGGRDAELLPAGDGRAELLQGPLRDCLRAGPVEARGASLRPEDGVEVMRLGDLCCKGGGAARGYNAAGFQVTGWDIEQQRNYPYPFFRADILDLDPLAMGSAYDAFHASPSCKGYTALRTAHNAKTHAREIPLFVEWLNATRRPWILENVEDALMDMGMMADLHCPQGVVMLCGSQFGLGTQGFRLERHRLFIANFPLTGGVDGGHGHDADIPVVGVYGGHARNRSRRHGGRTTKDSWVGGHRTAMAEALGIPVGAMTTDELSEAIPPAYTEFLGRQLMAYLT